jgi:hypothetical protein
MRSPRDEADIGSRARQLHPEISADRAGAVDTDFHEIPRASLAEFEQRSPAGFEGHLKAREIAGDG